MRRSSTSRSIGARSSIALSDDEYLDKGGLSSQITRGNDDGDSGGGGVSAHEDEKEDPEKQKQKRSEADQHLANYVSDQVEKVKRRDSTAAYDDEFETRASE